MRAPHAAGAAVMRDVTDGGPDKARPTPRPATDHGRDKARTAPRLTIIVVTYNSRADIDDCLTAITGERAPRIDHEVAVVDNASTDGTSAYLRGRWPAVTVIDAGGNLGFAAGNNVGIRHTSGDAVLLLNPDTIALPGAIDRLVATLASRPDAAIVGPRIEDREGHAALSFG